MTSEGDQVNEEELRKEAVRRRRLGESPETIAAELGRTSRWVRKWVARHDEGSHDEAWASSRSRAPHTWPSRTPDELRQLILDARARLVANPRAQYGALAIAWELRPHRRGAHPRALEHEREIARAGLARPRRRQSRYVPKGVPYPSRLAPEAGSSHQVDMVAPATSPGRSSSTLSTASTWAPTPRRVRSSP